VRRFLSRLVRHRPNAREDLLAGPLRGELLGAELLEERAQALAGAQRIVGRKRARRRIPLVRRLTRTRRILADAHARLTTASESGADVGPAGEWLLDNYHLMQEHIGEVRESLPRGYYRELPELASGPLAGHPRVYELAITLISHSEGRVDLGNISRSSGPFRRLPRSRSESCGRCRPCFALA
jgi:cyclic beta-1,2-glucan synthetase